MRSGSAREPGAQGPDRGAAWAREGGGCGRGAAAPIEREEPEAPVAAEEDEEAESFEEDAEAEAEDEEP